MSSLPRFSLENKAVIVTGAGRGIGRTIALGMVGAPARGPYSGAKAGVNNLTRTMAAEWAAHGIRVNAIAPTVTRSPMSDPSSSRFRSRLDDHRPHLSRGRRLDHCLI